jgi:hypothetical protein
MDFRVGSLLKKGLIGAVAMAVLALPVIAARAEPRHAGPHVGDTYEILRDREMSQTSDDGGTGRSTDRDTIVERVVAVRPDGLELEYRLPAAETAGGQASDWHFPVRVLRPSHGPMELLNRAELAARVEPWLKTAGLDRTNCGRLIFIWNAFRIDCDPQSVMAMLATFDPGPGDLRDGQAYADPRALAPAPLKRTALGSGQARFVVELAADPKVVRRDRAETDAAVAELMGKNTAPRAATHDRSADDISGTITIAFDTDSAGQVQRRTTVARVTTRRADGHVEDQTVTETVERRRIAP